MKPNKEKVSLGNSVLINQELTNLNFIETHYNFYELQDGVIKNILFKRNYKIFDNNITVKQKWKTINPGDQVVHSVKFLKDSRYKINFNTVLTSNTL